MRRRCRADASGQYSLVLLQGPLPILSISCVKYSNILPVDAADACRAEKYHSGVRGSKRAAGTPAAAARKTAHRPPAGVRSAISITVRQKSSWRSTCIEMEQTHKSMERQTPL